MSLLQVSNMYFLVELLFGGDHLCVRPHSCIYDHGKLMDCECYQFSPTVVICFLNNLSWSVNLRPISFLCSIKPGTRYTAHHFLVNLHILMRTSHDTRL